MIGYKCSFESPLMCIHACCRHNNGIGAWSRGLAADVVAQVMAQLRHAIHNVYKAGAELVIPVRSQSGFKESGVRGSAKQSASPPMLLEDCVES